MPLYFFHLVNEQGRSVDDWGVDYTSLEAAYLDAWKAALEMSFELLRKHLDPHWHRFEIADASGTVLLDLPFAEVLRPGEKATAPGHLIIIERTRSLNEKRRQLVSELSQQIDATRETLKKTRALLAASRSAAPF